MKASTLFLLPPYLPECFVSTFENEGKYGVELKFAAQMLWPKNTPEGKPEIATVIFFAN